MRKLVLSAMALAMTVALVGCGSDAPAAKPATTADTMKPAETMKATTPAMTAEKK